MLGVNVCRTLYRSIARRQPACTATRRGGSPAAVSGTAPAVRARAVHTSAAPRSAAQESSGGGFDTGVLQFLVCPLSRKPLRFDESTNELINDELGIAYPIVGGIPCMIPQDARMIRKDQKSKEAENTLE